MKVPTRARCLIAFGLVACGGGTASTHEELPTEQRQALLALSLPSDIAPPADSSNHWADDPAAATFGQRLFFAPGFSGQLLDGDNDGTPEALGRKGDTGKVSCAGCHLPSGGFSDTRSLRGQISLAAAWGRRRAPSLLDVAHSKLLMWDGRHDTLYNQVFGPIESPLEMNSSRLFAAEQVFAGFRSEYEGLFGPLPPLDDSARFPALAATDTGCSLLDEQARTCRGAQRGAPGDPSTYDALSGIDQDSVTRVIVNVGKAIGAYERLLGCGVAPFDRWITGEDPQALSADQVKGALLFVGKANCSTCHSGPFMSDEKFHNVGLKPALVATVFLDDNDSGAIAGLASAATDPLNVKGKFSDGDDGRLPETLDPSLLGSFRTPKLRCVSKRPSFMHTGQFTHLDDVVAFFDQGGSDFGFPGTNEIEPLGLTPEERAQLVAFMQSLDGPGPRQQLLTAP
jgi:cytochrome c peroxidase